MEPVLEDRESPDPDAWSGSNTPAELDDSQDEDYYDETDSEVDPKGLNDLDQDQQHDLDQDQLNDLDQDQQHDLDQDQLNDLDQDQLNDLAQDQLGDLDQDQLADLNQDQLDDLEQDPQDDLDQDPSGSDSSPPRQRSFSDYSADEPNPGREQYEGSDPGSDLHTQERSCDSPVYSHGSEADSHYATPSPAQDAFSDRDSPGQPQRGPGHSDSSSSGQVVTRPDPGRRVTSSPEEEEVGGSPGDEEGEGGGQSQAPPACASFGIPVQGAEAAEDWGSLGERDLHRASRNGPRDARLRRSQSQSEKQQKEAKSKCKRIASLLTNAPNPRNKGVLMFKKRRQRAKKFTLVSYGTGEADFENEGDSAEYEDYRYYDKDGQSIRITLSTPSDSEFEEEYYINALSSDANLNYNYSWGSRQVDPPGTFSWRKMEKLPQTKGKGVLMFAQRRQRMDEIAAEHEEMRSRGIPVEGVRNPEPETPKPFTPEESYASPTYMDASTYQHQEQLQQPQYQPQQQQYQQQEQYQSPEYPYSPNGMNGLDALQFGSAAKALVANRTAKPFLGGQSRAPATFLPVRGVPSPTPKKQDNIFKVPVPVNSAPQVWSPTGDIIASRDERISVPAIKTGILPETRRRGANKANDGVNSQLQTKGDRRSFIESGPEEDYLSLGAEACNFMQVPRVKHKGAPPPVAPKPTINRACPPWSAGSTAQLPVQVPRSPMPASSPVPAGMPTMMPGHGYPPAQPNWAPKQELQPAGHTWGLSPSPTQAYPQYPQAPNNHWAPASPQPQQSWMPQPQQAPVSMPSVSPTLAGSNQPKTPWTKPQTDMNSIASCPPAPRGTSYSHAPKAPPASSKERVSELSTCPSDKPKGKGAELFARRQSRMEKFVVDADTVQANIAKSPSPTPSLPSTWKYSSNVRAPPPTSYNPILSPSYPPGAAKQATSTSPMVKPKAKKEKPKPAPKHLNALDVMKHKPYQLDTSLFMYNSVPEVNEPSPKSSPVPPVPESDQVPRHDSPTKANPPVLGRSRSLSLPRRSMSSVSPQSPVFPYASPGVGPTRTPLERHSSVKPPSPWEAAAKSPLGLVDEAFAFQDVPQASAAMHRRSLPEPPLEWKQRVSYEPAGHSPVSPLSPQPRFQPVSSPIRAAPVSPSKPAFYGPPFRPAQPLTANTRYPGTGSLQRQNRHSNSLPPLRVSRVM
ncbi:synaptopodin-2 [Alosa sapidissima]|uniref:synaptopodin-2 n=1 Tax=Alosa sapidissima TaxID=34773 RepID=UPI001C08CF30|nr:synaptopodin-2 [Alosa sapidissima]